eukprot:GHVS01097335.1.p1 GENE.GHVS01097335.1~~GHVS01097335.1.p1  ORF type:complete len:359 (+),score=122.87 GHVS01097335.1:79-1077(+)
MPSSPFLLYQDYLALPSLLLQQPPPPSAYMLGRLCAFCSVDEMIDKQRTSTASDFERQNLPQQQQATAAAAAVPPTFTTSSSENNSIFFPGSPPPPPLPLDVDCRYINPALAHKSFQRSDANKLFKPADTRPVVWCRRAVHAMLTHFLYADDIPTPKYLYQKHQPTKQTTTTGSSSSSTLPPPPTATGAPPAVAYGFSTADIYGFLRDRLRAVWQDLTVQHCTRHRAYMECLEISFRYLLASGELLCAHDRKSFDGVQHLSLLTTCLDKLLNGYTDVRYTLQQQQQQQQQPANFNNNSSKPSVRKHDEEEEEEEDNCVPQCLYKILFGAVFR